MKDSGRKGVIGTFVTSGLPVIKGAKEASVRDFDRQMVSFEPNTRFLRSFGVWGVCTAS